MAEGGIADWLGRFEAPDMLNKLYLFKHQRIAGVCAGGFLSHWIVLVQLKDLNES